MFTFFGWDVILVGYFPQKSLSRNPKIGSLFSPLLDHTFSYLWPVGHLPYIGWVQVDGAWTLCACFASIWVHCFSGTHAFAIAYKFVWLCCTLWCLFNSCGVNEFLGLHSLHLISSLGWALLGYGLSLLKFNPCLFSSFIHGLAGALAIPLHCSCYNIIYLCLPCYYL